MCARSVTGSKHGTEANARPQSQPLHFTSYLLLAASGMCLSLQGHLKLECCHDLPLLVWPPVSKAAAGIAGPPCAARLIRVSEANFLRASWAPIRVPAIGARLRVSLHFEQHGDGHPGGTAGGVWRDPVCEDSSRSLPPSVVQALPRWCFKS